MQGGYDATNFIPIVCGQFQPCASARTNPTPDLASPNPQLEFYFNSVFAENLVGLGFL